MTCNVKLAKPRGEDTYVFALQNAGTVITVRGTTSLEMYLKLSSEDCYTDIKFIEGLDILAVATTKKIALYNLYIDKPIAEAKVDELFELENKNSLKFYISCTQKGKLSIKYAIK